MVLMESLEQENWICPSCCRTEETNPCTSPGQQIKPTLIAGGQIGTIACFLWGGVGKGERLSLNHTLWHL